MEKGRLMRYSIGIIVGFVIGQFAWITLGEVGVYIPNVGGYVLDWSDN